MKFETFGDMQAALAKAHKELGQKKIQDMTGEELQKLLTEKPEISRRRMPLFLEPVTLAPCVTGYSTISLMIPFRPILLTLPPSTHGIKISGATIGHNVQAVDVRYPAPAECFPVVTDPEIARHLEWEMDEILVGQNLMIALFNSDPVHNKTFEGVLWGYARISS